MDFNVLVGNSRCRKPYLASILNTVATSNTELNKFFIPPANRKQGKVAIVRHITQDEISTFNLNAEDLVWQIGPEYLGCRKECGNFNAVQFQKNVLRDSVKMIEINLSHSLSAGYCNVIPGYFAHTKYSIPANKSVLALKHKAFSCAEGMILFVGRLQELSGGKPVGFRVFISNKREFYEICYAIRKTQITPDFIVVESSANETGSSTSAVTYSNGIPLYEALHFVSKTLQHYGLDKKIKLIAADKIVCGFDILKLIALGADAVYTNLPDHHVAYHDQYVHKFRAETIKAMIDIMEVCGFKNPNDISLTRLFSRMDMLPLKIAKENFSSKVNKGFVKIVNRPFIKLKEDADKKYASIH